MNRKFFAKALCLCIIISLLTGCVNDIGEKAPPAETSRTTHKVHVTEDTSYAITGIEDDDEETGPETTSVSEEETSAEPVTEETETHPEETESSIIPEPQPVWTSETAPAETTPEETAAPETSAPETENA